MHRTHRKLAALASAVAFVATPSIASAWTKSWVIEWYEPAMYYGAKEGVIEPGSDCPKGVNPEPNWIQVMVDAGYTLEEAKWLRDPANPTRSPVHGQNGMAFRGRDRANVYMNPTSTPDPGLVTVEGRIAEGLDLDGNSKTGFVSPAGQTGIDNAFYKAVGCWKTFRGPPRKSSGALQMNDAMREGSWTVVIVASGSGKDPMNDGDVSIGFYASPDKLVKDANGNVARDYSFRIQPDAKLETILRGKTKAGRLVTQSEPEVWLRDPGYSRQLQLLKAKADLQIQADGSLKGYLGGYRPWEPLYWGYVNARGPVIEALTWVQLPAVYYALRRNADYSPTGPGGPKTHISSALRIEAVPAFVMEPDSEAQVSKVASYKAKARTVEAPAREGATFRVVDGLVMDPRNPDSVKYRPVLVPKPTAQTTASSGG